ncbi:MAG: LamG-like jellyroll fold domain-containing protein, partial [Myxococcota bacterium]|nr:LamG-like jellyroll fold domain-containing protein [Myxococcota bacterium]
MKHDLLVVACGAALFLFTAGVANAQVCPADAGNPCDSANDADLCTDGVIVCNAGVPSCEQEGARIWLPADEGSGAVLVNAADAPRQAEAAVGAAVTWTTGDVGLGVLLDSTLATSWLRIPKAEAVSQGPWTWSFKVLSTGSSGTVVSRTSLGQFDGFRYQVDGTVTLEGTDYASTPLPVGFWRHITIVLTNTHLKIYHDGSLVDDFAIAAQPTSWVSDIWFGQDQDSNNGGFQTSDAFSGILDDIVYYPRALSASQILDLYGLGVTFQQMHRELCDGVDNDCNPNTPDPKNTACDGPDSDLCQNGVTQCSGGFLGLTTSCGAETITDQIEVCNFLDDDCDGVVDNGTGAGLACDGPDIDQCAGGRFTCNGSGGKACGAEPVLHYDFDTDIAGAKTVYDATSWNHEAAIFAGAQYTQDGQSGRALDFLGGTSSLVRIHNTDALRVSEWAFSAWIRPTTDTQGTVLYQRNVFSIWRKVDGSIAISRGQLPTSTATGLGQVTKDQWTHLTVSVDEGLATVYINGAVAGSTALNNMSPVSLITHPVSLGCTTQTRVCQSSEFVGQLDEVNFFNRPLNASEVASLHANGATWFVPSREQCGVADGNCDGATATTAVGCTSYFRDGDSDGWGADTIGYMRPTVWWSMDEVSADGSFRDWSKNSVPLRRIGGSRRVLGYRGLGLEFDGTDRKVGAETAATAHSWTSFGEEMTLSSWISPHTAGIGVVTRTIAGSLANTWRLVINNSGKLQFRYAGVKNNGPSVTLNSWQQVGITIKGTTITFYRNGLPTAVKALPSPLSVQHGLSIGNRAGTGYQPFDGVIDEVILFARELTGPEMSTLFTADDHACLCGADTTHKVTQRGDCADDVFSRNPAATELCDTLDTDCNGTIDDIVSSACTPNDPVTACSEGVTACVGGGTSCIGRPSSYHSFDEGTGFIAYNQVTSGHSMSADYSASALWQPGSTGQAVELMQGNRLRSGKYDFSSGGAVSFRWKPEPPLLDTGRTLVQLGAARDLMGVASADIRLTTAGFRVRVQGIDVISEPYNEWVTAGQWHHLVFTWNESGASDSLSLWIDGLLVKTVTVDLGQIDFINLGSSPAETIGLVDDLVVYEREIPAALIRQLSSIGLNGSQLNREI